MNLSNGLAALSAYGVLLIVNNQIAKFVEEHPRKAYTSPESFIKWSLIFLFSTFTGLNLAFAKVLGYIWSSGILAVDRSVENWVIVSLIVPVLMPQLFSFMRLTPKISNTFHRTILSGLVAGYFLDFYLIATSDEALELSFRYTLANTFVVVVWYYLIKSNLPKKKESLNKLIANLKDSNNINQYLRCN